MRLGDRACGVKYFRTYVCYTGHIAFCGKTSHFSTFIIYYNYHHVNIYYKYHHVNGVPESHADFKSQGLLFRQV